MAIKIYAVPGTFCNENVWDELVKTLPENVELIHVAIPGKRTINEIIEVLLKVLPKEPCLLMGFSFGGYLISAFALKYPARVKKILVVADGLNQLTAKDTDNRKQFVNYIKSEGFSGIGDELVISALHPKRVDDTQLHKQIISMSQTMQAFTAQSQLLATITRENIIEAVTRLHLPTWFVIGGSDNTVDKN